MASLIHALAVLQDKCLANHVLEEAEDAHLLVEVGESHPQVEVADENHQVVVAEYLLPEEVEYLAVGKE